MLLILRFDRPNSTTHSTETLHETNRNIVIIINPAQDESQQDDEQQQQQHGGPRGHQAAEDRQRHRCCRCG